MRAKDGRRWRQQVQESRSGMLQVTRDSIRPVHTRLIGVRTTAAASLLIVCEMLMAIWQEVTSKSVALHDRQCPPQCAEYNGTILLVPTDKDTNR
jgi:hypothetical protein